MDGDKVNFSGEKLRAIYDKIIDDCNFEEVYFSGRCLPPFMDAPVVFNPMIIVPVKGTVEVQFCHEGEYVRKEIDKRQVLFVTSGSYYKLTYSDDSVVLKTSFLESGELYLCMRCYDTDRQKVVTVSQGFISKIRGLYYSLLGVLSEQYNTVVGYRKLTEAIICYCVEEVKRGEIGRSMKTEILFAGIKFYINVNYKQELNRQNIAQEFDISENYLSRVFKNKGVYRLWDYLTDLRIERAKLLLENYKLSVKEIASHCGFTGSSYFCKVFSQKMKCSPLEYRKKSRGRL